MDDGIDLRDESAQIDLRDRLRVAAGSLAADFGGTLTADHAEALVFSSAEGLLASASVRDFVPILAERRARIAARSGMAAVPLRYAAVPVDNPPTVAPAVADAGAADGNGSAPEPLFALGAEQLHRLRDRVDLVRVRVADWRAELESR